MPRPLARAPDSLAAADPMPEMLALLRQIAADVHILVAANYRAGASNDNAALSTLLQAIAAASGGLKFTVAELLLHAEVVADRAADQHLHDAIVGAAGAINGRRLGKLLGRLEGTELDGLRVVRVGADREGITWRVAGLRV